MSQVAAQVASQVAVVTDSTSMLSPQVARELGVTVVPLQVTIGPDSYEDGVDPEASPERVAEALGEYKPVSTSRPSPAVLLEAYDALIDAGAEEIVSVHLSGEVSATYESALLAARQCRVPVHAVDTRQIGAGTGFAAVAAARRARSGGSGAQVAALAREMSAATTSLFYVDTLEYLRRGGRVGAAAALLGSALAVKPLLQVAEGRISPKEKVRTSARALSRLEELAVEAAGDDDVDLMVSHLASPAPAEALAAALARRLEEQLGGREVQVAQVPAVLGAHVGPGLVGVTVAPAVPRS